MPDNKVIPLREWVPECFDEAEPVTLKPAPNSPRDGKSYPYEDVFVLLFLGALCTASYYFACWVYSLLPSPDAVVAFFHRMSIFH